MAERETPSDGRDRSARAARKVVVDRDAARDGSAPWLVAAARLVEAHCAGDSQLKRCQLDDGRWVVIVHVEDDGDGSSVFVGELRPPDGTRTRILDRTTIVVTEGAIHVY